MRCCENQVIHKQVRSLKQKRIQTVQSAFFRRCSWFLIVSTEPRPPRGLTATQTGRGVIGSFLSSFGFAPNYRVKLRFRSKPNLDFLTIPYVSASPTTLQRYAFNFSGSSAAVPWLVKAIAISHGLESDEATVVVPESKCCFCFSRLQWWGVFCLKIQSIYNMDRLNVFLAFLELCFSPVTTRKKRLTLKNKTRKFLHMLDEIAVVTFTQDKAKFGFCIRLCRLMFLSLPSFYDHTHFFLNCRHNWSGIAESSKLRKRNYRGRNTGIRGIRRAVQRFHRRPWHAHLARV